MVHLMRHVALLTALLAVFAASVAGAEDARPSFDCRLAHLPDERTICADAKLAQMDRAASLALGAVPEDLLKSARENALDLLKERHACGTNRICILDNQTQVIGMAEDNGAHVPVPPWVGAYRLALIEQSGTPIVDGLPKRVGACTRTKIKLIGTRFSETLKRPKGDGIDEGTTVGYVDGGVQVSYSYEAEVAASKIGDEVMLCLVSLPKNCPPGDDRGKFYSSTNLRTKGSWILPDSQHMCGGA